MSSVDDTATGSYTLLLGLFGDPEALAPARERAVGALKHFTDVFPEDHAYAQGLLESLQQHEPRRPAPPLPDGGQIWHASLAIARKSQQNWQAPRVQRFLKEISAEDPRLVTFGGLLSSTLPDAGLECLVVSGQALLVNASWGYSSQELLAIIGKDTTTWGIGHESAEIDALFGLVLDRPVVERALSDVSSRLRARLVGQGLPLAAPSRKGVRF